MQIYSTMQYKLVTR